MRSLKPGFHRYLGVMICILLILTILAPPILVARATYMGKLYLSPPVANPEVCLHSKNPFTFEVDGGFLNASAFPIAGATVSFQSDTGNSRINSSKSGEATFTYTAKTEGQHTVSATATKDRYSSDSTSFTVMVVKCSWEFFLDYMEEYSLFNDKEIDAGAHETYLSTFTVDDNGNIVPQGDPTINEYHFYAVDTLVPLDVGFDPKVKTSGKISIQVTGKQDESGVQLQLSSEPIPLPFMVDFGFTDVLHTRIITGLAPVATMGKADLIGSTGIASLGFPLTGGAWRSHVGSKIFLNLQTKIFAELTVRIKLIKP